MSNPAPAPLHKTLVALGRAALAASLLLTGLPILDARPNRSGPGSNESSVRANHSSARSQNRSTPPSARPRVSPPPSARPAPSARPTPPPRIRQTPPPANSRVRAQPRPAPRITTPPSSRNRVRQATPEVRARTRTLPTVRQAPASPPTARQNRPSAPTVRQTPTRNTDRSNVRSTERRQTPSFIRSNRDPRTGNRSLPTVTQPPASAPTVRPAPANPTIRSNTRSDERRQTPPSLRRNDNGGSSTNALRFPSVSSSQRENRSLATAQNRRATAQPRDERQRSERYREREDSRQGRNTPFGLRQDGNASTVAPQLHPQPANRSERYGDNRGEPRRDDAQHSVYRADRDSARSLYRDRRHDALRESNARIEQARELALKRNRGSRQDHRGHDHRDRYSRHGHRHHVGCGHYFYDGHWHNTSRYHRHGPGCGHYYHKGRWQVFASTHIHSASCGHFFDGFSWIISHNNHRHGPNCGHHHFHGRWHRYPRSYYIRGRPSSFYFFVDLGSYQHRNVSQRVYREYIERPEPVDVFRDDDPLSKAYASFAKGRFYNSLIQFNYAIEDDPDNGLLYLARAQAQVAVKDYRNAYQDLVRGMELVPDWLDAQLNLSEIYSDAQDLQQHMAELEQWVERYPRDFKTHFVLGYLYYFHQDYALAKSELIYVLSWDENHPQAQALMDRILANEAELEITREPASEPPDAEPAPTTE